MMYLLDRFDYVFLIRHMLRLFYIYRMILIFAGSAPSWTRLVTEPLFMSSNFWMWQDWVQSYFYYHRVSICVWSGKAFLQPGFEIRRESLDNSIVSVKDLCRLKNRIKISQGVVCLLTDGVLICVKFRS